MAKLLRILQTTVLAIFVIFVWPYVFLVSRDLLHHEFYHLPHEAPSGDRRDVRLQQEPLQQQQQSGQGSGTTMNVTALEAAAASVPFNSSLCSEWLKNVTLADEEAKRANASATNTSRKARIAIITVVILPKGNHFVTDHSQLRFGHVMENFVNKFKYAHHFDYDFIPIFWNFKDPDLPGAWAKVIALQRYLPRYDWIWCTDVDAFVTNRMLSIEEHVLQHVPEGKTVVVARDCNHLNTGSFFIKNDPVAFHFLDAVYRLRRNTSLHLYHNWYEQSAIIHVFDHNIDGLTDTLQLVPQKLINSYRINCGAMWSLGDFVVHFPGQSNKQGAWADLLREGGPALQALLP